MILSFEFHFPLFPLVHRIAIDLYVDFMSCHVAKSIYFLHIFGFGDSLGLSCKQLCRLRIVLLLFPIFMPFFSLLKYTSRASNITLNRVVSMDTLPLFPV